MKKIISLVFAGVLGGLIALGGVYLMNPGTDTIQTVSNNNAQTVKNNTTAALPSGETPGSFSASAKKAMQPSYIFLLPFSLLEVWTKATPFAFSLEMKAVAIQCAHVKVLALG